MNKKIIFRGRVLPEKRLVSIGETRIITGNEGDFGDLIFKISIFESQVTVAVESKFIDENLIKISAVRAREYANAIVDIIAFKEGIWLLVIIDQCHAGDKIMEIALSEMSVKKFCTVFSTQENQDKLEKIIFGNLDLRFAFNDLISSLATPNYSAIAAGRSIEVIRNQFIDESTSESTAWRSMRNNLNIDRGFIQAVTNASRGPRHGTRTIEGRTQMMVTHRAWQVMNRYLEFRLRGGLKPLSKTDFPILSE